MNVLFRVAFFLVVLFSVSGCSSLLVRVDHEGELTYYECESEIREKVINCRSV